MAGYRSRHSVIAVRIAAVQGRVGKVIGAITGGLIMGVIDNGMSLIGAQSQQVMLIKGTVLLAGVAFAVWSKRRAGAAR
jgi:putative multiple sugar transport system permease protein